jgi:hypothetical protein
MLLITANLLKSATVNLKKALIAAALTLKRKG